MKRASLPSIRKRTSVCTHLNQNTCVEFVRDIYKQSVVTAGGKSRTMAVWLVDIYVLSQQEPHTVELLDRSIRSIK